MVHKPVLVFLVMRAKNKGKMADSFPEDIIIVDDVVSIAGLSDMESVQAKPIIKLSIRDTKPEDDDDFTPIARIYGELFIVEELVKFDDMLAELSSGQQTGGLLKPQSVLQENMAWTDLHGSRNRASATELEWEQLYFRLRENAHPSRLVFPEISQLLSAAEDDLQRCNAEVAKQQAYLVSLQTHSRILQRQVDGYHSLFSPIRKLPPEILRQIFVQRAGNRFGSLVIDIPGLRIAQVCSHWRNVALDTKSLWSIIRLEGFGSDMFMRWSPIIRLVLERSVPHALSLSIHDLSIWDDRDILKLFAAQSHRWGHFKVGEPVSLKTLAKAFAGIKGQLPVLRSLSLPYTDGAIAGSWLDLFKDAPILDMVNLNKYGGDAPLPWAQLQTVKMYYSMSPMDLLSRCPQLINLHLINPTAAMKMEQNDLYLTSNIRRLTIEVDDDNAKYGLPFLSQLTLPSLVLLSLIGNRHFPVDQVFLPTHFESLISRSQCTITALSWTNIPIQFSQWITLLLSLPSLQELTVTENNISVGYGIGVYVVTDAFLDHLSSTNILPVLQHLSLTHEYQYHGSCSVTISQLVRTLQSRWMENDGVSLKSFKLDLPSNLLGDEELIGPLQTLRDSGMNVYIRDRSGTVLC
ncbi:hypothetical protein C8J56DRAFT_1158560 [Mycena floridula]|nr:hypothetical protein C8J56DRAFT_1158560 [Mycena floridula]